MKKQAARTVGGIDAVVGLTGLMARLVTICLAIVGLVSVNGLAALGDRAVGREMTQLAMVVSGFGKLRTFFVLGVIDCVLMTLLSILLFAAGIALIKGARSGRILAFSYTGGKLLLGVLTLVAVIVFFVAAKNFGDYTKEARETVKTEQSSHGGADPTEVQMAKRSLRAVTTGWFVQVMMLMSLVLGFFVAMLQLLLIGQGSTDSAFGGDAMTQAGGLPMSGTLTDSEEHFKTIIQSTDSPTISLQVYQSGKARETKQFELLGPNGQPNKFVIGRDSGCDLVISNDRGISAEHCSLKCDELRRVAVTDLDSSNGTFIKRGDFGGPQPVSQRVRLKDGDTLVLGSAARTQVRVHMDAAMKRSLTVG